MPNYYNCIYLHYSLYVLKKIYKSGYPGIPQCNKSDHSPPLQLVAKGCLFEGSNVW